MLDTTSTPPNEPAAPAVKQRTIPPFQYEHLLDRRREQGSFGDWRDQLRRDGYCVLPVMSRDRALEYRERAFDWLESFGYNGGAFDRTDPSTFKQENVPLFQRGGMYGGNSSGFGQEQFVWDIKTEPGVLGVFEKLWGTDQLVVSFDGGSLMLPGVPPAPTDQASWQHIDCSPHRRGFFCAQGLMNLSECDRDDDGGLLVMKGSSRLMQQFFDTHGRPPLPTHERLDWHMFSNEDKQWFIDQGCSWFKVNCNPGDLVLWDSSTMHQNQPPASGRDRFVVYVCMGPAHLMTEEDKRVREKAFKDLRGTTHTPFHGCYSFPMPETAPNRPETGQPDEFFFTCKNPRKETDQVLKLAGVKPY